MPAAAPGRSPMGLQEVSPAASGAINPSVDRHRYRLRGEHGIGAADDQVVETWLVEVGSDRGSCDSVGSPETPRSVVPPPLVKPVIVEHNGVKVAACKGRDAARNRAAGTQECKVVLLVPVGSDPDWCRTANGQRVLPAGVPFPSTTAPCPDEDSHLDSDADSARYGPFMHRATRS